MAISLKENNLCSTGSVACTSIQDQLNEVQGQLLTANLGVVSLSEALETISSNLATIFGQMKLGSIYASNCCMDPTTNPPCSALKCIAPAPLYWVSDQCKDICDGGTIILGAVLGSCSPNGIGICSGVTP